MEPSDNLSNNSPPPEPEKKPPKERWDLAHISEYSRNHRNEIAAYVILTLGILLLFFNSFLGQALVGIVFGSYFTPQILDIVFNYDPYSHQLGVAHSIILIGSMLALFILAPIFFIAVAAITAIKHFLIASSDR